MISRLLRFAILAAAMFAGAAPAMADWREDLGAFRVGILAGGDSQTAIAQAEPFRLAIEEGLGLPVEIVPARDYAALIDASATSRIEYAVFSATAFAIAWNRCECLEPVVVARSGDGTEGFSQVLVARRDGPASLGDLKGRRIAAIGAKAFGGLNIALRQMRAEGLDLEKGDAVLERMASGEAALAALRDGSVDALIGWSSMTGDPGQGYSRGTLTRIAALEGGVSNYRIIWQSALIAHRVHAVRKNLPGEARTKLRDILSAMFENDPVAYDAIEPVFGGGFVAARQGQFAPLAALLKPPKKAPDAGEAPGDDGQVPPAESPEKIGANEDAPDGPDKREKVGAIGPGD